MSEPAVIKKVKKTKTKLPKVAAEEVTEKVETAPVEVPEVAKKPKKERVKKAKEAEVEVAAETVAEPETEVTGTKTKAKKAKRIFTVVSVTLQNGELADFKGGKFCGSVPSSSARKSANQICKEIYGDDDCQISLVLKETTKGASGKEYGYVATRKKNEKAVPFTGKEGTVNIAFKYSMTMKALKKNAVTGATETETVLDDPSVV